ncbi:ROK family protein [Nocardioides acrostichi]|uniref:ROK family protein n=1 Tax=Nocardioides acrostichi TaxID=2784339 RepID=UPI002E2D1001|nr:ROK family protein [Nocardioides acrostichi]
MDTSPGSLLTLLRTGRASSRADLVRLSGLSRGAVTTRLAALAAAGLVREGDELASTGGRRAGTLELDPDAGSVLAVAVGRSRSQVGVFDLAGREITSDSRDHEPGIAPGELMTDVVDRLLHQLPPDPAAPVLGVGVSLPGAVDGEKVASLDAPVLAGWDGIDLRPWLAKVTDAPVLIDNDTAVLTRSELFGRAPAHPSMLVLKASTGLGLGMVVDGRIVGAGRGRTGELGHTRVAAAGDLPCRCGATGCLETIAGGWALVAELDAGSTLAPARHVRGLVGQALDGDPSARRLVREGGRRLGETLAVAVNLVQPGVLVVGGDLGAAFDLYTAGLRESLATHAHPLAVRDLRLLPATHGEAAGLHGCAALAIDHALAPDTVDARLA